MRLNLFLLWLAAIRTKLQKKKYRDCKNYTSRGFTILLFGRTTVTSLADCFKLPVTARSARPAARQRHSPAPFAAARLAASESRPVDWRTVQPDPHAATRRACAAGGVSATACRVRKYIVNQPNPSVCVLIAAALSGVHAWDLINLRALFFRNTHILYNYCKMLHVTC